MEKVVHISLVKGNSSMDASAPTPSHGQPAVSPETGKVSEAMNLSAVSVTVVGCGGCGINLARQFKDRDVLNDVLYFDTSMTNSRPGEIVHIVTNGSGSGSDRGENARDIERAVAQLNAKQLGIADVAIVIFSLAGGSGSVIGPLMIREYARQGVRVVGVAVADTSSTVGAKNTLNTLKTLTAIATNNNLYLPMIVLSNDQTNRRGEVDMAATTLIAKTIGILTARVFEVDRNDRLNWINPMKVVGSQPGLKLVAFNNADTKINPKLIVGGTTNEMIDSLLVLQKSPDHPVDVPLPLSRLKKVGFYTGEHPDLVGSVSSDIVAIEEIIDSVEKMFTTERAQKHTGIDRLSNSGPEDLVI